ncbi:hypothetical protein SESBI_11666 [Sesbania bispinosa]|nr:hypothetical protein SESBI_11666 [Sesbania bispinosa]
MAPPRSSKIERGGEILLKEEGDHARRSYTHHPTQAFKRPRMKNPGGIEKEYLPNGETIWRIL